MVVFADITKPNITLVGSGTMTVNATTKSSFIDPGAVATDTAHPDEELVVSVEGLVNLAVVGRYVLTYTAEDGQGNAANSVVRTVNVQDVDPPVLTVVWETAPLDSVVVLEGGIDPYPQYSYTAHDEIDGDISDRIREPARATIEEKIAERAVGSYLLTIAVRDFSENVAQKQYTIRIVDTRPPEASLPPVPVVTLEAGIDVFVPSPIIASDVVDGNYSSNISFSFLTLTYEGRSELESAIANNQTGTYSVIYILTDRQDNSLAMNQTVIVRDTIKPDVSIVNKIEIIRLEAGRDTYTRPEVKAIDNIDGNLSISVSGLDVLEASKYLILGSFTITYSAEDKSGNNNSDWHVVTIQHTVPPNLTISRGNDVVEADSKGGTFTPFVAEAKDYFCDGRGEAMAIIVESGVDVSLIGDYSVNYSVSCAGLTTRASIAIRVRDSIPPIMYLNGLGDVETEGALPYVDPGCRAMDSFEGNLTSLINVTGLETLNTSFPAGTEFQVNYAVRDSSGNTNSTRRFVRIIDTTPPSLNLIGAATIRLPFAVAFHEPGAVAHDTLEGNITRRIRISGEVNRHNNKTYTRSYSVSDSSNNTRSLTRTIIVSAPETPELANQAAVTFEIRPSVFNASINVFISNLEAILGGYVIITEVSGSEGPQEVGSRRSLLAASTTVLFAARRNSEPYTWMSTSELMSLAQKEELSSAAGAPVTSYQTGEASKAQPPSDDNTGLIIGVVMAVVVVAGVVLAVLYMRHRNASDKKHDDDAAM